ncbi:type II and III secretion system protein family protein [Sphingomonas quercus]|uniref:Pilus assembly protein N-terminal domain-containing protein n=1 Tax=Sphingomonas quercus TaxID=2842451 RepID=A0ABS6BP29_9SPHN|nr:type II and III secretion system protein family protein [Sphingomonas quercus]MBU3079029.1 pilus assembly protein N-terminal domain-containing protein [Sphingomonas quercus]
MPVLFRSSLGALAMALAAAAQPANAAVVRGGTPARTDAPTATTDLVKGNGMLVTLPAEMSDLFVADDKVADVQVRSPTQLWLFGRGVGETTLYATNKSGAVLWSTRARVADNLPLVGDTLRAVLRTAMPDAAITVTPLTNGVMLTGMVATPSDVAEAQRIVEAASSNDKLLVINRLKTATPMQVSLHVRIVEVSRTLSKAIGVNLLSRDNSGGLLFGVGRGNAGTIETITAADDPTGIGKGGTAYKINNKTGATTLGLAGRFLGMDLLASLDLAETDGLAVTLAEPNLTALSGETASFLAGGEIPIPLAGGLGTTGVQFKSYGVSLAFTPAVLSDGRISLRVRPEVSQLTNAGALSVGGYTVPALTTRRTETTVELGSGQSFVIGGLLQNNHNNSTDKAPFLGDLPILGALFRSNSFKKDETELVIVVTPYLVRPVDAAKIALPTDGYKAATDAARVLNGEPVAPPSGSPSSGDAGSAALAEPAAPDPSAPSEDAITAALPAPVELVIPQSFTLPPPDEIAPPDRPVSTPPLGATDSAAPEVPNQPARAGMSALPPPLGEPIGATPPLIYETLDPPEPQEARAPAVTTLAAGRM